MPFFSTKTYTHAVGLSCAFRQWRTDSHCRYLHGYALEVKITFSSEQLDENYWVQDFGGLKSIRQYLEATFDHRTIIAEDDPMMGLMQTLSQAGVVDLVVMPRVGCEAFAENIFQYADAWVKKDSNGRVRVHSVEVREHGGNSAVYSV